MHINTILIYSSKIISCFGALSTVAVCLQTNEPSTCDFTDLWTLEVFGSLQSWNPELSKTWNRLKRWVAIVHWCFRSKAARNPKQIWGRKLMWLQMTSGWPTMRHWKPKLYFSSYMFTSGRLAMKCSQNAANTGLTHLGRSEFGTTMRQVDYCARQGSACWCAFESLPSKHHTFSKIGRDQGDASSLTSHEFCPTDLVVGHDTPKACVSGSSMTIDVTWAASSMV